MRDWTEFYKKIYTNQDTKPDGASGWIQWKGTAVCIDLRCKCGAHLHFDGEFMYFIKCPHCLQVYAAGQTIKLIPLSAEDIALGEIREDSIKVPERDETKLTAEEEELIK